MRVLIISVLLILMFFSCHEVLPICEYDQPTTVWCQVTNWTNSDSIPYQWGIGVPLNVITYSPDSIQLSNRYFWSDQKLPMGIVNDGFWYFGAHWFPPNEGNLPLTQIRFYKTSDLLEEITAMRTAIVPQWDSPDGLVSYEDYKDLDHLCNTNEVE